MKKIKRDIISAWNEVEEVLFDLQHLDAVDLDDCKPCMMERLETALNLLGEYFSDDEAQEV